MGNILELVPRGQKGDWYNRCINLLNGTDTDQFMHKINSLLLHYPKCGQWLKWYLQDPKISILFPACKDIKNSIQRRRWDQLSDNTNGQEGLSGFLQALSGQNKMELDEVCLLCIHFIKKFSRKYAAGKDGMNIKWRTATGMFCLPNHSLLAN